jgi:hypothetical protein
VRRILGDTRKVARTWTAPIELLFIDAGHGYAAVRADIDLWTPFVVEGGLVALHDYPGRETVHPERTPRLGIHKAVHETLMAHPTGGRSSAIANTAACSFSGGSTCRRVSPDERPYGCTTVRCRSSSNAS